MYLYPKHHIWFSCALCERMIKLNYDVEGRSPMYLEVDGWNRYYSDFWIWYRMVHVSLEVALRHNTFKASGTQSIMETIEEIRKEFLKDVKKQVVLFSGPRKKFASSSILCFLYIPVSSTPYSLSSLPLIVTSSATTLAHVIITFAWITAPTFLLGFGFVLLFYLCHALLPPSLRSFTIRNILPESVFQTKPTSYYVSLSLDSLFSLTTFPKQYFPLGILTPTYISELARLLQASASWFILFFCLEIIPHPFLPTKLRSLFGHLIPTPPSRWCWLRLSCVFSEIPWRSVRTRSTL